jgi:hypothetical protein
VTVLKCSISQKKKKGLKLHFGVIFLVLKINDDGVSIDQTLHYRHIEIVEECN